MIQSMLKIKYFKGVVGGILVILVKNHFLILLNKFNLRTLRFSEVSDIYHCCVVIYQAISKFLCNLNTL